VVWMLTQHSKWLVLSYNQWSYRNSNIINIVVVAVIRQLAYFLMSNNIYLFLWEGKMCSSCIANFMCCKRMNINEHGQ